MTQPDKKIEELKKTLECPVCLDVITEAPIFLCENILGHSLCSSCHQNLRSKDGSCPVCRAKLSGKRSLLLENLVETVDLPKKINCRHGGCNFKRSDEDVVKMHEEECENRDVPCGLCDAKISLKGMGEHATKTHARSALLHHYTIRT